jgi:hypothetical protein
VGFVPRSRRNNIIDRRRAKDDFANHCGFSRCNTSPFSCSAGVPEFGF